MSCGLASEVLGVVYHLSNVCVCLQNVPMVKEIPTQLLTGLFS